MKPTELYLIRHGQTDWNKEGRWQGQLNSHLTPLGVAQAQAVARRLEQIDFSTLYASDLDRTMKTAQEISRLTGHEIIPDVRLRERAGGIMEGRTMEDARRDFPDIFAQEANMDSPHFAFPGGESTHILLNRAVDVLAEIGQRHRGERVVIVSHGAILGAFLRHLLGMSLTSFRFRLNNCGLSAVSHGDFGEVEWIVNTLNETGYLDNLEVTLGSAE